MQEWKPVGKSCDRRERKYSYIMPRACFIYRSCQMVPQIPKEVMNLFLGHLKEETAGEGEILPGDHCSAHSWVMTVMYREALNPCAYPIVWIMKSPSLTISAHKLLSLNWQDFRGKLLCEFMMEFHVLVCSHWNFQQFPSVKRPSWCLPFKVFERMRWNQATTASSTVLGKKTVGAQ